MVIKSIRGMHDCLPEHVFLWQQVENILKSILDSYGYNEIRFPIVEFTDLFKRAIGEITDVVEKEMYSFSDHHGYSLTLRPEGTSGCVRAGIENSLFYHQEQRLWYIGPMFRYERPQKGRYRQFHQFSAEVFGHKGPDIDAELILITARCWKELGIGQYVNLEINSLGELPNRVVYRRKLISFLEKKLKDLDGNSIRRLYSNPMRILDTKNNAIKELLRDAPVLMDYLDQDSKIHFSKLCKLLSILKIPYQVNTHLVRGLDYYNRTVFEWVTNDALGVKKTICAGGRYDNLVNHLGGGVVPAVGFSIGLERVLLLIETVNKVIFHRKICIDVYLIHLGNNILEHVLLLSECIRQKIPFLRLKINYGGGDFKQQFERAKRNNARIVLVMDNKNFSEKLIVLKDLQLGKQEVVGCNEITERLEKIFVNKRY